MSSNIFPWASHHGLKALPDYERIAEVLHRTGEKAKGYGDKRSALARFCKNFHRLPESVKTRLTVENDDRASMYSVRELVEKVHSRIGIPIVYDAHHHTFCTGNLSAEDAIGLAVKTWGDVKPVIHYSQSRAVEHNDTSIMAKAHSDSYWTPVNTYGHDVDVMLECKHKELGLFKMRQLLQG